MKKLVVLVAACTLLLTALPSFGESRRELNEKFIKCADDLVMTSYDLQACEESKGDAVAVGVAAGAFAGAGGLNALATVIGNVNPLTFLFIGIVHITR